jgi:hypothetical protein
MHASSYRQRGERMKLLHRALLTLLAFLAPLVHAHKPSDAYLFVNSDSNRELIEVRLDVALRDLHLLLPLDNNGDGKLTWGELKSHRAALTALLDQHLQLQRGRSECHVDWQGQPGSFALQDRSDGSYLSLHGLSRCGDSVASQTLAVRYSLLRNEDATHRLIATTTHDGIMSSRVVDPGSDATASLTDMSSTQAFGSFVLDGMHHIAMGYDHIAFLLVLLLGVTLLSTYASLQIRSALCIVTAFTIAHSLTLTLAATGWVRLPATAVELAIAATVVLAALNNLRKFIPGPPAVVAFSFGLVHGFGFAEVLREAALPRDSFAWALAGFNVGIEIGQAAIVMLWFAAAGTAAYALNALRRVRQGERASSTVVKADVMSSATQLRLIQFGSLSVAGVALYWFVERLPL